MTRIIVNNRPIDTFYLEQVTWPVRDRCQLNRFFSLKIHMLKITKYSKPKFLQIVKNSSFCFLYFFPRKHRNIRCDRYTRIVFRQFSIFARLEVWLRIFQRFKYILKCSNHRSIIYPKMFSILLKLKSQQAFEIGKMVAKYGKFTYQSVLIIGYDS